MCVLVMACITFLARPFHVEDEYAVRVRRCVAAARCVASRCQALLWLLHAPCMCASLNISWSLRQPAPA